MRLLTVRFHNAEIEPQPRLTFALLFSDIISRSATEIVKNCFVEDNEEAKNLPWTREQVWYLVKALSKQKEVSRKASSNIAYLANSKILDS